MNDQWISGGVVFKEGDEVVVMCDCDDEDPDGMGAGYPWMNSWCERMNEAFGKRFTIDYITGEGVFFVHTDDPVTWYGYPLKCMENMTVQKLQVHSGDVVSNSVVN